MGAGHGSGGDTPTKCIACEGPLEPGFLEDQGEGSRGHSRWVEGNMEKGIFGFTRLWGRPRLTVAAYRCLHCGRLELVAQES